MYLDTISPQVHKIQYGHVGTGGDLGYDGLIVSIQNRHYSHAISMHPPSMATWRLSEPMETFHVQVGINDTSIAGATADFFVYANGVLVGAATRVRSGEAPRQIEARLGGATTITLEVRSEKCEFCHAVWLDPLVTRDCLKTLVGVTGDVSIKLPPMGDMDRSETAIVSVVSPSYVTYLEDFAASLRTHANLSGTYQLVWYALEENDEISAIAKKYGANLIQATRIGKNASASVKQSSISAFTAAYSAAQVVLARRYILLDVDTMILGDLSTALATLDILESDAVLVCREQNEPRSRTLRTVMTDGAGPYFGEGGDAELFGLGEQEAGNCLIVNGGVIFTSREGLLSLESMMRTLMPESHNWLVKRSDIHWREQCLLNLALAKIGCGVALSPQYNVQLLSQDKFTVLESAEVNNVRMSHRGKPVRIVHLNGGVPTRRRWEHIIGKYSTGASQEAPKSVVISSRLPVEVPLDAARSWSGAREDDTATEFFRAMAVDAAWTDILLISDVEGMTGAALCADTPTGADRHITDLANRVSHLPTMPAYLHIGGLSAGRITPVISDPLIYLTTHPELKGKFDCVIIHATDSERINTSLVRVARLFVGSMPLESPPRSNHDGASSEPGSGSVGVVYLVESHGGSARCDSSLLVTRLRQNGIACVGVCRGLWQILLGSNLERFGGNQ